MKACYYFSFQPMVLLFTAALLAGGCASPQKFVEDGDYDQAIETALKRLHGKKNKKQEYVNLLEAAFEKATDKDMRRVEALNASGRNENWPEVYKVYKQIKARQEKIEPLLPLADKYGVKADFRFGKIEILLEEAKGQAAEYYYQTGLELMSSAREGDKLAARKAYDQFTHTEAYYKQYKSKDLLKSEAQKLGVTHVALRVENHSGAFLPKGMEQEMLRMGLADLNDRWKQFHPASHLEVQPDLEIVLNLSQINVSPDRVDHREYVETREIEDGFEYVLDGRGNVLKDSLGNDVKIPKKSLIKALVIESYQIKTAAVLCHLDLFDARRRTLIDSRRLDADVVFENYAATFQGDPRALTEASKNRIGNRPVAFPADADMVLNVMEKLKPAIKKHIQGTRFI